MHTAANDQLQTLQQELTTKDKQLVVKEKQLAGKEHQLQQKEATIASHQHMIQQLRQQLEKVIAEFQKHLLEREKMMQDQKRMQQQLRQREGQRQEEVEASGAASSGGSIKLTWRDGGRAPCKMVGEVAAVEGSVAYFRSGDVYSKGLVAYKLATNEWSELSKCPNYGFSLAVVNSFLTAIGGKTPNYKVTDSLLSLTDNKWTEQFPPMPTKRWLTAVVCSGKSLAVAGGIGERDKELETVEVMDTETLQWSTASSLPHPLSQATAVCCRDQVCMLGGWVPSGPSKSVFTCSLATLLRSCQAQSPGGEGASYFALLARRTLSLAIKPQTWHKLTDTPVTLSTFASLHGQLLAVGGRDSRGKMTTAIHMYNPTTNSWEVISHMATPRTQCLVAVLPHNELMVVGSYTPDCVTECGVEIASII